jgi:cobalt-zinc-cadmium efflux system outer membrane protein
MKRIQGTLSLLAVLAALFWGHSSHGQQALGWDDVKSRFISNNPVLSADAVNVEEVKAEEITAFLRPNPQLSFTLDQLYPYKDPKLRPFSNALTTGSISYLYEREHKRNLRLESAKEGTQIASSQHEDMKRNLLFNLRASFVEVLEAKTIVELSKADLEYYDHIIEISRARLKAGDLAQIDLDRIELLRVQYESEMETAIVNLRTAKIQLLQMLNDRTPVDSFDVTGSFDWQPTLGSIDSYHKVALENRPDLAAAIETIQQSQTNYKLAKANGSTDPTFAVDSGANPPLDPYVGFNVSIPLRIFDRNQGEKKRTLLDIDRSRKLADAATAQVFSDVDSAYEQVRSNIVLLTPYKDKYNAQALRVRDTVTYAYQHGGASLMDFLNAQSDYRVVQLAYVQLVGAYLTAVGQLNLAVGHEVIQ